jgi:hypothetical protein
LNEEKLCQLLANQTRAREKALQQTVTARPQQVVAAQVQHQTLSHVKTVAEVAQTFALQVQMHRASHVQRVRSSKSALQRHMALHQSVPTVTAMVQLVQSVLHTVTAIHAQVTETAMTALRAQVTAIHVLHTETAMTAAHVVETVRLMAVQVLQPVAATAAR